MLNSNLVPVKGTRVLWDRKNSIQYLIQLVNSVLKGNLRSEKSSAQMKEREKCKKLAITELNAPNGSRDIPFQSQEFEQYGRRHFVDF